MKAVAGLFLLLGLGVLLWQRRAKSCDRHRRWAGGLAYLLACLCLLAGVALMLI